MKQYQIVINNNYDGGDFYTARSKAFEAAEAAFDDETVETVDLITFIDDEPEDFPLCFRREDGNINQYRNGERLWA